MHYLAAVVMGGQSAALPVERPHSESTRGQGLRSVSVSEQEEVPGRNREGERQERGRREAGERGGRERREGARGGERGRRGERERERER